MTSNVSRSGRIRLTEFAGFGGNSFDSVHLSRFFSTDHPHNFGMKVSKIFSSSNRFDYKPMIARTMAAGNFVEIPTDIYRWTLLADDYRRVEITHFLETGNSRVGFNGEEFKFGLSEGWYHVPDILGTDDPNFSIEVIGYPVYRDAGNYYEYTGRLHGGNPNEYIPSELLQPGRTVCKVSTTVGIEMNQEAGTISFGTQIDLQSQVGAFAEGFDVTDRVIREELNAKKKGMAPISENNFPYTAGYTFSISDNGKQVPRSGFMTFMEAKVLNQIENDVEWSMWNGKVSTRKDSTGRYIKRTAPGFRELAKDGWEKYYNSGISATELEDYFMNIMYNRVDEGNRKIVVDTGTLGSRIFDQLLSDEMGAFLTPDTANDYFVRQAGGPSGDLEFGFQFKRFRGKNGIVIELSMNPMKDSYKYSNTRYPHNPLYTIESARMDIMDFSPNGASEAPDKSNMTMVKIAGVDSYAWKGSMVDPKTGVVNNGTVVASFDKGVAMRRETSGALVIFDTSRIGSLIYDPAA